MTQVEIEALISGGPQTLGQAAEAFRKALEDLGETPTSLAARMHRLGDRRPVGTILRGIQRMASGETRVSGEMHVIIGMMDRDRQRAKFEASRLLWSSVANGCVTTRTCDFTISLSRQSRGRWLVNLVHAEGYNAPWPEWQPSLEEAKIKSLLCLDEALATLEYHKRWADADQVSQTTG